MPGDVSRDRAAFSGCDPETAFERQTFVFSTFAESGFRTSQPRDFNVQADV